MFTLPRSRRSLATLLARATVLGLALLLPWLPAGCQGYRQGSVAHPQLRTVAVGEFTNDTKDAALTATLRGKLAEALQRDGSLKLVPAAEADLVIHGRIAKIDSDAIGHVRRNRTVREDNSNDFDNYRSAAYEAKVTVEFEASIPNLRRPVIANQAVTGIAAYNPLPDLEIARAEGMKRATANAASEIANAVLEGW